MNTSKTSDSQRCLQRASNVEPYVVYSWARLKRITGLYLIKFEDIKRKQITAQKDAPKVIKNHRVSSLALFDAHSLFHQAAAEYGISTLSAAALEQQAEALYQDGILALAHAERDLTNRPLDSVSAYLRDVTGFAVSYLLQRSAAEASTPSDVS